MIRVAAALLFGLAALPAFYGAADAYTVYATFSSASVSARPAAWALLGAALLLAPLLAPWVVRAAAPGASAARGLALGLVVVASALGALAVRAGALSPTTPADLSAPPGWAPVAVGGVVALRLLVTFPVAGLLLGRLSRRSA